MMKRLRSRTTGLMLAWFVMLLLLGGCTAGEQAASPGLPPVITATAVPEITGHAADPTATATASLAPRLTPAAQLEPTRTPSATPTAAPTTTATASPSPTASPTPGPTPDLVARELHVPIVMYHYISKPPAGADDIRLDLSVTPERFESHLQFLADNGYQTITLDDLLYALAQGHPLPPKPIVLTFDDGYEDNFLNAFPLLEKYGMIGHFFIMTDVVGAPTPGYMSWPQIEEMSAAGQRFGSHARYHNPDQQGRSTDYLVWHALGALEAIQEHLGYHPRWVAYPSGKYDAQTIAVYQSAHYWGGLTTIPGATHTLDDIFTLRRVRIHGSYTAENLAALLGS